MPIDRTNFRAAAWAWLYCLSLVLGTSVLDSLGVSPLIIVPLAIVVLPLLVTVPFSLTQRQPLEKSGD
jgi:hypothetical protein